MFLKIVPEFRGIMERMGRKKRGNDDDVIRWMGPVYLSITGLLYSWGLMQFIMLLIKFTYFDPKLNSSVYFAIAAAFSSLLAALCHGELAIRTPGWNAVYTYTYNHFGEFCAFIVGWNFILQYLSAAARIILSCVVQHTSSAVKLYNNLVNHIDTVDETKVESNITWDFFGIAMSLYVVGLCIKKEIITDGIIRKPYITCIIHAISFCTIASSVIMDYINHMIFGKDDFVSSHLEYSKNVLQNQQNIVLGIVYFNTVYSVLQPFFTLASQTIAPAKNIPIAIIVSITPPIIMMILTLVFLNDDTFAVYFGKNDGIIGTNTTVNIVNGPFFNVYMGCIKTVTYVLATLTILVFLYLLEYLVYDMVRDGLIFPILGIQKGRIYTFLVGFIVIAIIALIGESQYLSGLICISNLVVNTMIAVGIIVKRYRPCKKMSRGFYENLVSYIMACIVLCILATHDIHHIFGFNDPNLLVTRIGLGIALLSMIVSIFIIASYEHQSPLPGDFRVPMVPFVPGLCILLNIYFMQHLISSICMGFIIWMIFGIVIYFCYGINHGINWGINVITSTNTVDDLQEKYAPIEKDEIPLWDINEHDLTLSDANKKNLDISKDKKNFFMLGCGCRCNVKI